MVFVVLRWWWLDVFYCDALFGHGGPTEWKAVGSIV